MSRKIQLKRPVRWSMLAAACLMAASLTVVAQQATPALAATNQFKGVNWADTRDNYNTGWVIPDGLSASDGYARSTPSPATPSRGLSPIWARTRCGCPSTSLA